MKKNVKEILIGVLAFLVIAAVIAIFIIQRQNQQFKEEIVLEKEAITKELESVVLEKDSITNAYHFTAEELQSVNYQLEDSQVEINKLTKDLKNAKNSYRTIAKLKKQLNSIKLSNENIFKKMDSIQSLNDSLKVEIVKAKTELNEEKLYSEELASKLSDATKIQITNVNVYAVKESSSGYKATTRYRKADAFKVEYNVLNNKALANEKCDVFYVLKGVDGKIINPTGEFTYQDNTMKFTSGDRLTLTGETMSVTHMIPVNDQKLVKGMYTIEFYSTEGLLSKRIVTLKAGIF